MGVNLGGCFHKRKGTKWAKLVNESIQDRNPEIPFGSIPGGRGIAAGSMNLRKSQLSLVKAKAY